MDTSLPVFQPTSENMTLAMMIINQMLNRIQILETRLDAYEKSPLLTSDNIATLQGLMTATDMMMMQAGVDDEEHDQVPDVEGASSEGSAAHDDAPGGCDR